MANWDFTADSEIQEELAGKVDTAANNYDTKVELMYTQINSMSQYWVGEDYDKFVEGTEGYRNALKDLSDGMRMYSKHFTKMASGTDELASELIDIVNNMTGANSGGSGGTGGTGTGGPGGDYIGGSPGAVSGGDAGEDDGGTEGSPTAGDGDTNGGNSDGDSHSPSMSYGAGGEDGSVNGDSSSPGNGTLLAGAAEEPSLNAVEPENGEETRHVSGFQEYFTSNSYWQNIGNDYAENFDFSGATGLITGAGAIVEGTSRTVVDAAQTVGNVVCDGVNDALEAVEWFLWGDYGGYDTTSQPTGASGFTNPYNPEYYSNLGAEFADNFDYSNVDNFAEGVWATASGVVQTVWDGVGVAGHAVIDTAQGAVECVEWAWNGLCDGAEWLLGHLI